MKDYQLKLAPEHIAHIKELTNGGNKDYYKAYKYISGIIHDKQQVDDNTKVWFERAAEINRNDPESSANVFIRSVSNHGLAWDGRKVDMQDVSDKIGNKVIGDIIKNGNIPPLNEMVSKDISVALDDNKFTLGGWGGSFYYWDLPIKRKKDTENKTVGELITNDPKEYEKFIAANAAATVETVKEEWNGAKDKREFSTIVGFSLKSKLPFAIKTEILDRAIEGEISGNYAGNPNMVSGNTIRVLGVSNHADFWFYNKEQKDWRGVGDGVFFKKPTPEVNKLLNEIRNIRLEHGEPELHHQKQGEYMQDWQKSGEFMKARKEFKGLNLQFDSLPNNSHTESGIGHLAVPKTTEHRTGR